MRTKRRTSCLALASALVGAVIMWGATARGQDAPPLDYQAVQDAIPLMKGLSDRSEQMSRKLHVLVDQLDASQDRTEQQKLRAEIRALLEEYLSLKKEMIQATRQVLGIRPAGYTDQEIVDKLASTNFFGIHWDNASFKKCIQDVSAHLGIPIRLQQRVVQRNTVSLNFAEAPAKTVLSTLCNGFDLRYVVHEGEIVIYKKITPTEERFLEYQKRHPEVKLKYWESEDASGDYKEKK